VIKFSHLVPADFGYLSPAMFSNERRFSWPPNLSI
jgi:hypothetical protein